MTLFKKKSALLCTIIFSMGPLTTTLVAKKDINQQGPLPKNFFNKTVKQSKGRALSSSDTSALSSALASTSISAGNNALELLATIAGNQTNAITAFFNICLALTTPDSTHDNATPISLATPAVRLALSNGVIEMVNDSYNYTLLHFATLYSVFGNSIDATINTRTGAATIISTILSGLTQAQIIAAVTAVDMWGSTPLHYAAMSSTNGQSVVTSALLSKITSSASITTAISTKNTWGYTPVHYAATFAPNATDMIKTLFTGTTATQKIAALSVQDQWLTTPLHYAALLNSSAILNKTFLLGITQSQKIAALNIKNFWNHSPANYATFDVTKSALMDPMQRGMSTTDLKTSVTLAVPTPKFELQTIVAPTFLISQV
jgi:hypothetical protein